MDSIPINITSNNKIYSNNGILLAQREYYSNIVRKSHRDSNLNKRRNKERKK